MSKTTPGVIHGKTIVLDAEPGLADGQRVAVIVRPVINPEEHRRRLADLAGVLADRPDADWEALDLLVHERS